MRTHRKLLESGGGSSGPVTAQIVADGKIFRLATPEREAYRIMGISAFPIMSRLAAGEDMRPFLEPFEEMGFREIRNFDYVPAKDWGAQAWDSPGASAWIDGLGYLGERGWRVLGCMLTDDDPDRIKPAQQILDAIAASGAVNFVPMFANEPITHKAIDFTALRWNGLYTTGLYEDTRKGPVGRWGDFHSARDAEWMRKSHDAVEYWNGEGPNYKNEPACRVPWVGGEPIRPDQAAYPFVKAYRAYFGGLSIMAAGGVFHFTAGKFCSMPEPSELEAARAAIDAMRAFPASAPLGPYRRIPEKIDPNGSDTDPKNFYTLRTYVVEPYMVRVEPKRPEAYEPGWTPLDAAGILWARA